MAALALISRATAGAASGQSPAQKRLYRHAVDEVFFGTWVDLQPNLPWGGREHRRKMDG